MTSIPLQPQPVALRPLALPSEHGGWGLLLEPVAAGLIVAPSGGGLLIAVAAVLGFLARHPIRLALQDARRARRYPRTGYCWAIAAGYSMAALIALASALLACGGAPLLPFVAMAPAALVLLWFDANGRSRQLLPEIAAAAAICSTAAAIALAGGASVTLSLGLAGAMVARAVPAVLHVRAMLRRSGRAAAVCAHVVAVIAVAAYGPPLAIAATVILLCRALCAIHREPRMPQMIGWQEVVYGVVTVGLVSAGYAAMM